MLSSKNPPKRDSWFDSPSIFDSAPNSPDSIVTLLYDGKSKVASQRANDAHGQNPTISLGEVPDLQYRGSNGSPRLPPTEVGSFCHHPLLDPASLFSKRGPKVETTSEDAAQKSKGKEEHSPVSPRIKSGTFGSPKRANALSPTQATLRSPCSGLESRRSSVLDTPRLLGLLNSPHVLSTSPLLNSPRSPLPRPRSPDSPIPASASQKFHSEFDAIDVSPALIDNTLDTLKKSPAILTGSVFSPRLGVESNFPQSPTHMHLPLSEQRIPPSAAANKKQRQLQQRGKMLATLQPMNVLKMKIFYKNDVVAVRLRKDLLSSTDELVDVTLYKLAQRYSISRNDLVISLTFSDCNLKPVILSAGSSACFATFYNDICMEYIRLKSKVYILASPRVLESEKC